jgi:hypothetical protein
MISPARTSEIMRLPENWLPLTALVANWMLLAAWKAAWRSLHAALSSDRRSPRSGATPQRNTDPIQSCKAGFAFGGLRSDLSV